MVLVKILPSPLDSRGGVAGARERKRKWGFQWKFVASRNGEDFGTG